MDIGPLYYDSLHLEFSRGVEVGYVWAALVANPEYPVAAIMRFANYEMIMRMAETAHRAYCAIEIDDAGEWLSVYFAPRGEETDSCVVCGQNP